MFNLFVRNAYVYTYVVLKFKRLACVSNVFHCPINCTHIIVVLFFALNGNNDSVNVYRVCNRGKYLYCSAEVFNNETRRAFIDLAFHEVNV